jgi:hypothetical protein
MNEWTIKGLLYPEGVVVIKEATPFFVRYTQKQDMSITE